MARQDDSFFSPLFLRLFIPFGAAYFISVFLGSANAIMSPILVDTFSLSANDLGFMSSIYLISFGLAQFPLGVFLDRYGARMTLAPALLLAAAGAVVFGLAQTMGHLMLARALSGAGLSCCLMGAFKAYADWLPAERLPLAYSIQSLTGGIGGMAATRPVALAFEAMSWRTCFMFFAVLTFVGSALIWFVVPKDGKKEKAEGSAFFKLLAQMLSFFKDGRFWYIAPVVTASQSVMFAYLYLWVSPWMRDVARMQDGETGIYMMYAFTGAAAGYFLNGVLADFFQKKGWLSWEKLYLYSGALLTAILCFIAVENGRVAAPLWSAVMFLSTMTMISFPLMRRLYDSDEVGRALSLLNFMIFLASFVVQWFIGFVLNFYPVADGHFSADGHKLSLLIITAFNLCAVLHLFYCMKKRGKI